MNINKVVQNEKVKVEKVKVKKQIEKDIAKSFKKMEVTESIWDDDVWLSMY